MAKRARALHDFQYDPPTTVFLLSMRYEVQIDLSRFIHSVRPHSPISCFFVGSFNTEPVLWAST
jgi:hypothetical protein